MMVIDRFHFLDHHLPPSHHLPPPPLHHHPQVHLLQPLRRLFHVQTETSNSTSGRMMCLSREMEEEVETVVRALASISLVPILLNHHNPSLSHILFVLLLRLLHQLRHHLFLRCPHPLPLQLLLLIPRILRLLSLSHILFVLRPLLLPLLHHRHLSPCPHPLPLQLLILPIPLILRLPTCPSLFESWLLLHLLVDSPAYHPRCTS